MKRKTYRIEEEYPSPGDLFQTKVGSRLRILQFYRMEGNTVLLSDGKRLYRRKSELVQAVRINEKLLLNLGFITGTPNKISKEERLVHNCNGFHFEAYNRADVMHIEITPEGTSQKTLVCCDFLHELQHLKRLQIAGIDLPIMKICIFSPKNLVE